MLDKTEIKFLIDMLEKYDDVLSNAGCNDMDIEDTPENRKFVQKMIWDSDYPKDEIHVYDGNIQVADFEVVGYLIERLKAEA